MQHDDLFTLFLRTGVFTIGGGLAAVPILKESIVDDIMVQEQFLSMIAVSQSAPGSFGANMATYIGVSEIGFTGALVSVFALALPSILVIMLIAQFFPKFSSYDSVQAVFATIRPAVTGLILSVALSLTLAALFTTCFTLDVVRILIFATVVYLHLRLKLKSISLICIGALMGILFL